MEQKNKQVTTLQKQLDEKTRDIQDLQNNLQNRNQTIQREIQTKEENTRHL